MCVVTVTRHSRLRTPRADLFSVQGRIQETMGHAGAEHRIVAATERESPRPVIRHQIFQWKLQTILDAHLYGHIDEVYALRAIARALREWLD